MVTTITPAVGRNTPKQDGWLALSVIHSLGNAVGGVAAGLIFGTIGIIIAYLFDLSFIIWAIILVMSILFSLADLHIITLPYPQIYRQVPAEWRTKHSLKLVSFLFGVELGTGVLTRISTGIMYVVFIWIVSLRDPLLGALILTLFGVGRSLPIFVTSSASSSVEIAVFLASRLDKYSPLARLISGLLLAFTAGAAATRFLDVLGV